MSTIQLGLAGSLFTWTYSAYMPVSGWLADRHSRPLLVTAAIVLWSMACLGTAISSTAAQLLASRVAMGITESLYVPAAIALITDFHGARTRSRALSIHGFAQFVGITLGGFYGGWSAEHIGWRHGYASLTVAGVIYAAILGWRFRGAPSTRNEQSRSKVSLKPLIGSPLYWSISAAFLVFCAMLWIGYTWLPTFIHERYGLGLTASGVVGTLFTQSGAAAGVLFGGWLGDYAGSRSSTGRFYVTANGLLLCAPFALAMFATHSLIWLKVTAVMFGLCSGLFVANVFSSLFDAVNSENFGFATGLLNMTGGLGAGAAVLLAAFMKDRGGLQVLMQWTCLASILITLSLFIAARAAFGNATESSRAVHDR